MPTSQDFPVLARMAFCGADVADSTVPMIVVVPDDEVTGPLSRILEISKPGTRELWSILRRAEQRFDKGVVVADTRP